MVIGIKKEWSSCFNGDEYLVDLDRKFEGYKEGDLICYCAPFFGIPLVLDIAIRRDGSLIFRGWTWTQERGNSYLHTDEKPGIFYSTQEQKETVAGLFSGRIRFEGLKLAVGATVQKVCPIDVKAEEERVGEKIYLA